MTKPILTQLMLWRISPAFVWNHPVSVCFGVKCHWQDLKSPMFKLIVAVQTNSFFSFMIRWFISAMIYPSLPIWAGPKLSQRRFTLTQTAVAPQPRTIHGGAGQRGHYFVYSNYTASISSWKLNPSALVDGWVSFWCFFLWNPWHTSNPKPS
jgi:hypothetical protein